MPEGVVPCKRSDAVATSPAGRWRPGREEYSAETGGRGGIIQSCALALKLELRSEPLRSAPHQSNCVRISRSGGHKLRVQSNVEVSVGTGGRGGIRTHGGLPHARFRVECLKPDSATLPSPRNLRTVRAGRAVNVEYRTLNASWLSVQVERSAFRFLPEFLDSSNPPK